MEMQCYHRLEAPAVSLLTTRDGKYILSAGDGITVCDPNTGRPSSINNISEWDSRCDNICISSSVNSWWIANRGIVSLNQQTYCKRLINLLAIFILIQ